MITKKMMLLTVTFVLMTLASATTAFGATTANQGVSVTVAPTVSIDIDEPLLVFNNLIADGASSQTENFNVISLSNVRTDMTITASQLLNGDGDPVSGDDLTLADFAWASSPAGGSEVGHSGVLTTGVQAFADNIQKAPKSGQRNVPASLTVTAPVGTNPDTYTTTITYTIAQG